MINISTALNIGLEKPFSFIHISDTHLTFADDRDGERKVRLARDRSQISEFFGTSDVLAEVARLAKEAKAPIIHTGDLIDFVSCANLEAAKRFSDETDCLLCAGNHEFSLYVGEAWEDAAYRNQSLDRVQQAFHNDIRFSATIINGINFVGIDNSYYLIEKEQLEHLRAEAQKEYPIILFLHTPLYTPALYDLHRELDKDSPVYLMNVPASKRTYYSEDRTRQQAADEITEETYDFIVNCPQIKAILAGHLHFDYEGNVTPTLPQIITGCSTIRTVSVV